MAGNLRRAKSALSAIRPPATGLNALFALNAHAPWGRFVERWRPMPPKPPRMTQDARKAVAESVARPGVAQATGGRPEPVHESIPGKVR